MRVREASNLGLQLSRQRSLSQGADDTFLVPTKASVELLDAMQEDFEGTQVRRTRRRVISDDDRPVTQGVSAAVPSFMTSRRLVLVPGAPGDSLRSGPDRREYDKRGQQMFLRQVNEGVWEQDQVSVHGRRRLVLMSHKR